MLATFTHLVETFGSADAFVSPIWLAWFLDLLYRVDSRNKNLYKKLRLGKVKWEQVFESPGFKNLLDKFNFRTNFVTDRPEEEQAALIIDPPGGQMFGVQKVTVSNTSITPYKEGTLQATTSGNGDQQVALVPSVADGAPNPLTNDVHQMSIVMGADFAYPWKLNGRRSYETWDSPNTQGFYISGPMRYGEFGGYKYVSIDLWGNGELQLNFVFGGKEVPPLSVVLETIGVALDSPEKENALVEFPVEINGLGIQDNLLDNLSTLGLTEAPLIKGTYELAALLLESYLIINDLGVVIQTEKTLVFDRRLNRTRVLKESVQGNMEISGPFVVTMTLDRKPKALVYWGQMGAGIHVQSPLSQEKSQLWHQIKSIIRREGAHDDEPIKALVGIGRKMRLPIDRELIDFVSGYMGRKEELLYLILTRSDFTALTESDFEEFVRKVVFGPVYISLDSECVKCKAERKGDYEDTTDSESDTDEDSSSSELSTKSTLWGTITKIFGRVKPKENLYWRLLALLNVAKITEPQKRVAMAIVGGVHGNQLLSDVVCTDRESYEFEKIPSEIHQSMCEWIKMSATERINTVKNINALKKSCRRTWPRIAKMYRTGRGNIWQWLDKKMPVVPLTKYEVYLSDYTPSPKYTLTYTLFALNHTYEALSKLSKKMTQRKGLFDFVSRVIVHCSDGTTRKFVPRFPTTPLVNINYYELMAEIERNSRMGVFENFLMDKNLDSDEEHAGLYRRVCNWIEKYPHEIIQVSKMRQLPHQIELLLFYRFLSSEDTHKHEALCRVSKAVANVIAFRTEVSFYLTLMRHRVERLGVPLIARTLKKALLEELHLAEFDHYVEPFQDLVWNLCGGALVAELEKVNMAVPAKVTKRGCAPCADMLFQKFRLFLKDNKFDDLEDAIYHFYMQDEQRSGSRINYEKFVRMLSSYRGLLENMLQRTKNV